MTPAVARKHPIAADFNAGRVAAMWRNVSPSAMNTRPAASMYAPVVTRYPAAPSARMMMSGREIRMSLRLNSNAEGEQVAGR